MYRIFSEAAWNICNSVFLPTEWVVLILVLRAIRPASEYIEPQILVAPVQSLDLC